MDATKLRFLKLAAEHADKPIDRVAVLELIAAYEGVVRAEGFWSDRAPKMVDEINALRPIEPSLRALVTHARLVTQAAEAAEKVLGELDAVRTTQAAS